MVDMELRAMELLVDMAQAEALVEVEGEAASVVVI